MFGRSWSLLPKAVEKRLRSFFRITDAIVATGVFVHLARNKVELQNYFSKLGDTLSAGTWSLLLREKAGVVILSVVVIYLLIMFRFGSRKSFEHAAGLFSRSRMPQEWTSVHGYRSIAWMVGGFYVLILGLVLSVERISVFCLLLAALFANSLRSHLLRRRNLRKYFVDPRFLPGDNDDHKPFIMRRRLVVEHDLFGNGRVIKETLVITACIITSITAFAIEFAGYGFLHWFPYFLIMWTLVLNETITSQWRGERDRALGEINADQEKADRQRIDEDGGTT